MTIMDNHTFFFAKLQGYKEHAIATSISIFLLTGFLRPKFQHFSLFPEKCLLDNTTGIRYLYSRRLLPQYDCCLISNPASYWDSTCYST